MKKWILRIVFGIIILAIIGALGSYLFMDRELSKMYGGHTERATLNLPNTTRPPTLYPM